MSKETEQKIDALLASMLNLVANITLDVTKEELPKKMHLAHDTLTQIATLTCGKQVCRAMVERTNLKALTAPWAGNQHTHMDALVVMIGELVGLYAYDHPLWYPDRDTAMFDTPVCMPASLKVRQAIEGNLKLRRTNHPSSPFVTCVMKLLSLLSDRIELTSTSGTDGNLESIRSLIGLTRAGGICPVVGMQTIVAIIDEMPDETTDPTVIQFMQAVSHFIQHRKYWPHHYTGLLFDAEYLACLTAREVKELRVGVGIAKVEREHGFLEGLLCSLRHLSADTNGMRLAIMLVLCRRIRQYASYFKKSVVIDASNRIIKTLDRHIIAGIEDVDTTSLEAQFKEEYNNLPTSARAAFRKRVGPDGKLLYDANSVYDVFPKLLHAAVGVVSKMQAECDRKLRYAVVALVTAAAVRAGRVYKRKYYTDKGKLLNR